MSNAQNNAAEFTAQELADFASAVKIAAKLPLTKTYHGELAYIGSIKAEYFPRSDRATFDAKLVAAHQSGLLRLKRADLVGAMDQKLVAASHIELRGAFLHVDFHFVVVD